MAAMTNERAMRRVMRFLGRGEAVLRAAAAEGRALLDGGERGVVGAEKRILEQMRRSGLVEIAGGRIRLTASAHMSLKRVDAPSDPFRARHQERESAVVVTETGRQCVVVDQAESPLAVLWRRKLPDGSRFLDAREFRAGERLRVDYTRGQIMPRLGINWSAAGSGGRKQGDADGLADLTDTALAARSRVEKAIEAVGPELSGVLIDVCCFLKGLERVEAERRWPARSAKVVLKSALAALARHYEPPRRADRPTPVLHWGAEGYRPTFG